MRVDYNEENKELMNKVADKLNARPMWNNLKVKIKEGIGFYPAEVANWDTVKQLANKGILTVGAETDTCENQVEVEKEVKKLESAHEKLEKATEAVQAKKPRTKKQVVVETTEEE